MDLTTLATAGIPAGAGLLSAILGLVYKMSLDSAAIRSDVETFLSPRIVLLIGNQVIRRIKMTDLEKATATLELDDAKGFPTGGAFDQPPVWSIDDATIASITPSADGLSCVIAGLKPGNANVSVAGVAATVSYKGTTPVVVTASAPAAIKVNLGAAVPQ